MNTAIIGAGNVGGALGQKLAQKGHQVIFGVRHKDDPKYNSLRNVMNVSFEDPAIAVSHTNAVMLATPWTETPKAIAGCGSLEGKVLIDCTNPLKPDYSGLDVDQAHSGSEMIAQWAKGAKVVKCFNHTGFDNMINPVFNGKKAVMFAAGNDSDAVNITASLAEDVGFEAIKLNELKLARQLEHLAWLWIHMARKQNLGRDFAFGLLRR